MSRTFPRAMRLHGAALLCFLCVHQVIGSEQSITVYRGQSVVLKSDSESPWNFSRIRWSIYKNTTFIASLQDGKVTIFAFWRHQGRLKLNSTTGDLTINNLTIDDSMTYTMELVNKDNSRNQVKIHLTVQEQLQKPHIQKVLHSLKDGQCHMALNCTAFGQNVVLSWTPSGDFNGSYITGCSSSVNSFAVVLISFSGNVNVTFNCTASSEGQTETRLMTVGCSENHTSEVCKTCSSCISSSSCRANGSCVMCIVGFVALLAGALVYAYKRREQIKDFCINGPIQFIQNLR